MIDNNIKSCRTFQDEENHLIKIQSTLMIKTTEYLDIECTHISIMKELYNKQIHDIL